MPHPAISNGSGSLRDSHSMDRSGSFQSPDPVTGIGTGYSSHRRYSSTDSMDSGHSRTGSENNESIYPTRRSSMQMSRRQSTGDPLQFIKGKPSIELAQLAEAQIKVAAESKKVAEKSASLFEEDTSDWQSNLSSWKNRRKSQSERSYQMKEELEKMERDKEGEGGGGGITLPSKTYSQIQEERERRKSVGRHFYPIQDEDEEDIFSSANTEKDKKNSSDDVFTTTHKPKAEIAPWARDNDEEDKDNRKNSDKTVDSLGSKFAKIGNDIENNNNEPFKNNSEADMSNSKYSSDSKLPNSRVNEASEQSFTSQQQSSVKSTLLDAVGRGESFKGVGPKTQDKIGSIMEKFQDSQGTSSAPKAGYNERVDLKARMRSFEKTNDDSQESVRDRMSAVNLINNNNDNNNINNNKFSSHRNMFENKEDQETEVLHVVRERSNLSSSESKRNSVGDSLKVEKTVKIRQNPDVERGFGFILTGGTDKDKPLSVSRVALGSGADLSELKTKDEIVKINQIDVTDKTSTEVGDMVAKAVEKGWIELTVHRERSEDDLSEDEMTSSSDEGEEDLSHPIKDNKSPSELQSNLEKNPELVSQSVVEMSEAIQPVQVERAQFQSPVEAVFQPAQSSSNQGQAKEKNKEEEEEDDDGGPPAILRKWQRQRQRNEYAFENSPSLDSHTPVYKKISLNAPMPQVERDDTDSRWHPSKPWDQQQDEWTRLHDQKRQSNDPGLQNETNEGQAAFDAKQKEMKKEYEDSLKNAEQRVEEISRKEQEFLQPEIDKARILEERRQQRRNRIQESAAAAAATASTEPMISSSSSSSSFSSNPSSFSQPPLYSSFTTPSQQLQTSPTSLYSNDPPPASNGNHVTSMTFNIEGKDPSYAQSSSFAIPRQTGSDVIVIDPRNQNSRLQLGAPLEFQVKLASQSIEDTRLKKEEEDRERQRKEEEEEKLRKIQEKERELQEQEEKLRRERENFRKEQEELRQREKQLQQQQQIITRQQQQKHFQPPPPSPLKHRPHPNTANLQPSSTAYVKPSSVSPVFSASSASPVSSSPFLNNSFNSNTSQGSLPSSKPTWPPPSSQKEQPRGYDSLSYKSANNMNYAPVQPQLRQTGSNPRNPQDSYNGRVDGPQGGKFSREDILAMNKKPFREPEMTAANHSERQTGVQRSQNKVSVLREPAREPAAVKSQNQIHPSNSAPKARLKDDSEWQDPNKHKAPELRGAPPQNNRDRHPNYGSAQDHWLVQEAERRRSSGVRGVATISGPIKPLPDINNRWREGGNPDNNVNNGVGRESMPQAIRQTLLQKTAGARSSDGSSHEGDLMPPLQQHQSLQQSARSVSPRSDTGNSSYHAQQDFPGNYRQPHQQSYSPGDRSNKYNINPIHQIQQSPPHSFNRTATPPSSHHRNPSPSKPTGRDNGLPVNGSQLCSHCNQELGFGAAMVIESLGIFFHLQCFRCCVCHASLGTGAQGADVRVRMNKLHCQNCYSNDEGNKYGQPKYRSQKIWIKV